MSDPERRKGPEAAPSDAGLVCFDLGDVLIRLAGDWNRTCELAGVTWDGKLEQPFKASEAKRVIQQHERGQLSLAAFCSRIAELAGCDAETVRRVFDVWLCGVYQGAAELVEDVAERVDAACLSNTNDLHWRQMNEPAGINCLPWDRMRYCFVSHHIGEVKPHPGIYAHVERVTGLPGRQIVFFDNKQENVTAAAERGWHAHQIDPAGDPIAQMRKVLAGYGVL
jgi:FMN phosphatase YigB (HAD superfamily)